MVRHGNLIAADSMRYNFLKQAIEATFYSSLNVFLLLLPSCALRTCVNDFGSRSVTG